MLHLLLTASLLLPGDAFIRSKGTTCWIENPEAFQVTSVWYSGQVRNDTAHGNGKAVWMSDMDTVMVYTGAFDRGRHMTDFDLLRYPPRGTRLEHESIGVIWSVDTLRALKPVPLPKSLDELDTTAVVDVAATYSDADLRAALEALTPGAGGSLHGTAIVAVEVFANGSIGRIDHVLRVNAEIDRIAEEAVHRIPFTPGKKGGTAARSWVRVKIAFN